MPSTQCQRQLRKINRKERRKIKRKIQGFLLISAFVISVIICVYKQFFPSLMNNMNENVDDNKINGRHLLVDTGSDGYYIESLDEFPPLLFTLQQVKNGAWIIYFVGMFYCFLGIAIICDDYFVPAISYCG